MNVKKYAFPSYEQKEVVIVGRKDSLWSHDESENVIFLSFVNEISLLYEKVVVSKLT